MANRNLELLVNVARLLKPLLSELVFLGGCTTVLLVTDSAAGEVRPTFDVDVIAEITSYAEYITFSDRLRALSFSEDQNEGAPLCRWRHGDLRLDVMPIDERILGFSNRWYRPAMVNAQEIHLERGLIIRSVTAPFFLATKLEAFKGRGRNDYFGSHDLEDIMVVIDGRPSLAAELQSAEGTLKTYVSRAVSVLLEEQDFLNALPGYLLPDAASQARLSLVLQKLHSLAALSPG